MDLNEVRKLSKDKIGSYCKACPVCDGRACSNKIPGPGAKGKGKVAIENYDAWQKIKLKMDTIAENKEIDTSFNFFGYKMKYPIFAGPVGAVGLHYSNLYTDDSYNKVLIEGCAESGIIGFTGDGLNGDIMINATKNIKENNGLGVPTVKPWDKETCFKKLDMAKQSGALAIAMDIDAAGLPFLQNQIPPAGRKSVLELKEIIQYAEVPFIIKGVLSVNGSLKAVEAGAKAIVVSNHGGRVLDDCASTAAVLKNIAEAVKGKAMVLVDGGIRSGGEIFKALALGADAVLIARPYVNAIYGADREGVKILTETLGNELKDAMMMCGVSSLKDISIDNIYEANN